MTFSAGQQQTFTLTQDKIFEGLTLDPYVITSSVKIEIKALRVQSQPTVYNTEAGFKDIQLFGCKVEGQGD